MLFVSGVLLMMIALALQTITFAGGYGPVLLGALGFTACADACFLLVARRAGTAVRILAYACMLPTLYVVDDFLRRAPYVFH